MEYTVILQEDEEGNWLASVPAIEGCHTWGHPREEALANAKEAIQGCLETLAATGNAIPQETHPLKLARVKVASPV
ncbi:MAG TPA: type II toxin-antitoxin system HicB family antitoxin, partial [Dehalococcoidia bacterium]|nr:type II toxin-antitoxin system HicB family antitoxin [Dehalococcoidia bacterium]